MRTVDESEQLGSRRQIEDNVGEGDEPLPKAMVKDMGNCDAWRH